VGSGIGKSFGFTKKDNTRGKGAKADAEKELGSSESLENEGVGSLMFPSRL